MLISQQIYNLFEKNSVMIAIMVQIDKQTYSSCMNQQNCVMTDGHASFGTRQFSKVEQLINIHDYFYHAVVIVHAL